MRDVRSAAPDQAFAICATLLRQRDPAAQAALQHCLAARPGPEPGWAVVGAALRELGQVEAALVCLTRAGPGFDPALQRGLIARDLGRREEARRCFAEAVRLEPASARAWFLLGVAAQDCGDRAGAAAAYRAVLRLDPARAEAALNLGTVLQDGGDLAGAKASYAAAVTARADTFGRAAQALATAPRGELWLDLAALRRSLTA